MASSGSSRRAATPARCSPSRASSSPGSTPRPTGGSTRSAGPTSRASSRSRTRSSRTATGRRRSRATAGRPSRRPARGRSAASGPRPPRRTPTTATSSTSRSSSGPTSSTPCRSRRSARSRTTARSATRSQQDVDEARRLLDELAAAGVDYDDVVETLEREGVQKFADSFAELLDGIAGEARARSPRLVSARANPLEEGLGLRRKPDPCALIIFGASGDLTQRKLFPALYALAYRRLLPERFAVVGVARTEQTTAPVRAAMREAVQRHGRDPFSKAVWNRLADGLRYVSADFADEAAEDDLDRVALGARGEARASPATASTTSRSRRRRSRRASARSASGRTTRAGRGSSSRSPSGTTPRPRAG